MFKKILYSILILAIVGFCVLVYFADITTEPVTAPEKSTLPGKTIPHQEITLPADAIKVSGQEEIIDALTKTIEAGNNFVNFDLSGFDKPVYSNAILYNLIVTKHPEINCIRDIHSQYNEDLHLLSTEIVYRYYVNNEDIFYVTERPDLYLVLDKKVLLACDTFQIELRGKRAPEYDLTLFTSSATALVGEDDQIQALWKGVAYLRATITSKSNSKEQYIHTFKVLILPGNVPRIDDIGELVGVAKDNLSKTSHPIFVCNEELSYTEMQRALSGVGMDYITCTLDSDMTSIDNHTGTGLSLSECADKLDMIEEKTEEIVSEVTTPDMTELEKETALYDYLIQSVRYDDRIYDDPESCPFDSSTAYGPLFSNTGVCAGYAYALKALFTKAGIECITVVGISKGEDHMWNIAQIDGVYYQLDPTFDSGMTHLNNELSHDYFNISDEEMKEDHTWVAHEYPPCTDERYE